MSDKIKEVVKRLRDRAEARRRSGKLLQIDDRMFDLIADEIEEAAKALEADRDNWRRQALDEDARANATREKSSQVGNAEAMREALKEFVEYSELVQRMGIFVRDRLVKITTKAREALATPPRYCDIMPLDKARTVWFLKEIIPRLDGKLPLGKEKPFDEWFVSQYEKGETND